MLKPKICRIPGKFTHKGTETVFGDRHWSFITPGAFTLGEAKRLQDWANRLVAHLEHAKEQKNAEIEKRRERARAKKASKDAKKAGSAAFEKFKQNNYFWGKKPKRKPVKEAPQT